MVDYTIAAQTPQASQAVNPMQTLTQYQGLANAMLQNQQAQRQMQQQNALTDILGRSGGTASPQVLKDLIASGNYDAALKLQHHAASMGSIGVHTAAAQTALEKSRLELGETKRAVAANNAVTDYLAKTSDYSNPDALDVLRKSNPDAWRMVNKHIGELNEITARARKEGTNANEAAVKLAQTSASFILGVLPSVKDQASYSGVYKYVVGKDPNLVNIVSPEYSPENLARLQALATNINDLKVETRDGVTTVVNPRVNTEQLVGGAVPVLGAPTATTAQVAPPVAPVAPLANAAPGLAASMNAVNAMGGPQAQTPAANAMTAPPVNPIAQAREAARAQSLVQKEAEAAATARGQAAGKKTAEELELTPQITSAIKNIEDAIKPGGLLDKATGSGVGNIIDKSLGFLGIATGGAVATAQLQPIADMALKLVPRFEGPQSDADRQSYVDAAGALADASKPIESRRAAAQTIVRLMQERKDQFGVNKGQGGEGIPGERRAGAGSVTVQIPGGKPYVFPNQAAADKFRKEAGL